MADDRIYLSVPHMGDLESEFVAEAFRSNWLSTVGPQLDAFEREMADYLGGGRQTVAVSSGTAALHLALRAAGVEPGDRVAVSTLTFAGSVYPILYLGAEPVFLDSEATSGNMDPELLREYLNSASHRAEMPKAVVLVHLYGQHADVDAIYSACEEHGVILIEDAAESLGSTYRGRQTGTTAALAILSFNGNKMITTTGGGMVVAREAAHAAAVRKWANQSREPAIEYVHRELGYNYRMSNVLAAIGRGQLRVLEHRVRARRAIAERYSQGLCDIPGVWLQAEAPWGRHSRWLTVLFWDPSRQSVSPHDLVLALAEERIEARPLWRPMHTQPVFAGARVIGGAMAERLFAAGLCLPSSSSLLPESQDRVIHSLRRQFAGALPEPPRR
jgi:dTDP-4-amino-4,6-dideoxygalactose transaminase